MSNTIITASLVVYNCDLDKLYGTIDTFLSQENVDKYLVIVDNASTKRDIIDSLKNKYNSNRNVAIINGMLNRGYGGGNNIGFIVANEYLKLNNITKNRYHVILNPDLIIEPLCLQKMTDFMDTNKDIGLCAPKICNMDGTVQELNKEHPTFFDLFVRRFLPKFITKNEYFIKRHDYYVRKAFGYDKVVEVPFASGCFMFFRPDIYETLGGFDEEYFLYMEDADISRRTGKITKVMFFPDAIVKHHWERATHKNLKMTLVAVHSAIIYFRKHGFKLF